MDFETWLEIQANKIKLVGFTNTHHMGPKKQSEAHKDENAKDVGRAS